MDLLKIPNLSKELSSGENSTLRFGVCAMKGWRKRMEDPHITDISKGENGRFNIFGVFDGHGGKEVAQFVSNHFTESFLKNEKIKKNNIKQAICDTFLKMDELMFQKEGIEELKSISKKCQEEDKIFFEKNNVVETELDLYMKSLLKKDENIAFSRGCTACVCVIDTLTGKIFFANAGDSRVILCKKGKAYRMSVDHKPELELESNRIKKADGWVSEYGRINGNLNLSRTLGDLEYKNNKNLPPQEQIITAYPDVVDDKIGEDNDFIVIGCDGIWDCIQDQDVCDIITEKINKENNKYKVNLENILGKICDNIYAKRPFDEFKSRDGYDNMSIILIQFKK
jgi:protein phosphatase 1G